MPHRAYSTIEIKAVDDEQRIIEGLASTPMADRMGDIIMSEGAEYTLPLPFLWQHNSREPIGHVLEAKVTKKGISIKAQIAKDVNEQIENAWKLIKSGLVRGLSIGFRALEVEDIPNSWSVIVKKWEWLELSAVTIPANADASITRIKSVDRDLLAASGNKAEPLKRKSAGASAKSTSKGKAMATKKTTAELIAQFEATRVTKQAELDALMEKSGESGETLNAEDSEAYDTLEKEIESIDAHLKRLRKLEKSQARTAKPVSTVIHKDHQASDDRDPEDEDDEDHRHPRIQVRANRPKPKPGIMVARMVRCKGLSVVTGMSTLEIAKVFYKGDDELDRILKAVVVAGSSVAGTWAADLVGAETTAFADFVEFLRPQTIIGKFGNNGIPSLRSVPFRVALVQQTAGGQGYWVGQGKAKPLTAFDFDRSTLEPLKAANIAVLTEELIRDSSPSAETLIRDQLVAALRERLDIDFIDPNKAASAGVSPASVLNGISGIPSSGNTEDDVRTDVKAVMQVFINANNPPTSGVWIMKSSTALALSLMVNTLGQSSFPGITMNGGTFLGLPVITTEYVGDDTAGAFVALVNAQDIYFADDGGFDVAVSREASLQMDDAPTQSSIATVTATSVVSMFQTNSVAFRAERTVNWKRRRTGSVAWLSGVNWGAGS